MRAASPSRRASSRLPSTDAWRGERTLRPQRLPTRGRPRSAAGGSQDHDLPRDARYPPSGAIPGKTPEPRRRRCETMARVPTRVLIVDDHEPFRAVARQLLERAGYRRRRRGRGRGRSSRRGRRRGARRGAARRAAPGSRRLRGRDRARGRRRAGGRADLVTRSRRLRAPGGGRAARAASSRNRSSRRRRSPRSLQ